MKIKHYFLLLIVLLLSAGCASGTRVTKKPVVLKRSLFDREAYSHYLEGALFDFGNQFEKALIEYYQALTYDSTSAQILKAIARDYLRLQKFESAMLYLKKSYRRNPRDPEILNYLAKASYNLKDFQQSVFYFEKLLELTPYNTDVQNSLVFLYTHLQMSDRLIAFYKRMMELYPNDQRRTMQYALACLQNKKTDEAQRVLNEVVQSDSSQLQAWFMLGSLREMQKDTVGAIQIYRKILQKAPSFTDVLEHLYRIFRAKQDWQSIEAIYQPLVKNDSTNSEAHLILAEAYYLQKKRDAARKILQPILKDNEYRPGALELLGRIALEEDDLAEAENYFTLLTRENPKNRFGWLFLGVIYNRQKEYQKVLSTLRNALNVHKNDPDLLVMYGSALDAAGQGEEALKPLEKAVQLEPDNINAIAGLAAQYDKLKMWDRSDSLYESALKKFPENALLLNNYSYSLSERGVQLRKAQQLVDRALQIEPDNGAYLDTKGWIYYRMGQFQNAYIFIKKALEQREESAEVIEHLGDVLLKLGKPDEARQYWKKALEKAPDNEALKEKIRKL
ncbi:MAG TPA: tetratricopeptide repeat protein [Caldithrix sp.]|nr:tetratricopeptide repeat protein [Caldithrix sp.]